MGEGNVASRDPHVGTWFNLQGRRHWWILRGLFATGYLNGEEQSALHVAIKWEQGEVDNVYDRVLCDVLKGVENNTADQKPMEVVHGMQGSFIFIWAAESSFLFIIVEPHQNSPAGSSQHREWIAFEGASLREVQHCFLKVPPPPSKKDGVFLPRNKKSPGSQSLILGRENVWISDYSDVFKAVCKRNFN